VLVFFSRYIYKESEGEESESESDLDEPEDPEMEKLRHLMMELSRRKSRDSEIS
jgi:hypothetical protein